MKYILGIETSCDETAAAVVGRDGSVLSNTVASQAAMHARYGGIVPEVASRQHVLDIGPVVTGAITASGVGWDSIEAVAVTNGPGLAGSLIVGLNAAKGIAASLRVPLVGVNHLEGHIYAAWLKHDGATGPTDPAQAPGFPLMCLIVSGGHTELVLMRAHGDFELVGETADDAAGEAFDKAARVLGLRYPGGPEIQRVSEGAAQTERFPVARMAGEFDFSFSGLKSALIRRASTMGVYPEPPVPAPRETVSALARGFQEAVVSALVEKTVKATERFGCRGTVLVGGVAANRVLRARLIEASVVPVSVPHVSHCTDNGAMVAMSGWYRYEAGYRSDVALDVDPGLRIGVAVTRA